MKTVLKIVLGIIIAAVLLIGGCAALLGAGIEGAQEESDKTAITQSQYQSIKTGTSRDTVESRLGEPQSRDEWETEVEGLSDEPLGSECIYYGKKGEFMSLYQFCFDSQTGKLESKSSW